MQAAIVTPVGLNPSSGTPSATTSFSSYTNPFSASRPDDDRSGSTVAFAPANPWPGHARDFIPVLEATGMILDVGRFVLEETCRQAAVWAGAGRPLTVSVNPSGRQLDHEDFVGLVERTLELSGLEPPLLTIEITETTLMQVASRSALQLRAPALVSSWLSTTSAPGTALWPTYSSSQFIH